MKVWPLRFLEDEAGGILFTDDAGGFFRADEDFLERYATRQLSSSDRSFLKRNGQGFEVEGDPDFLGFAFRWSQRQFVPDGLDYLILVPTLRCNLACSYCQVSRAAENASGFDWTEDAVAAVLAFLDGLATTRIKIEFQGGEPLLRLDLLARVRDFARQRFAQAEFVVCTNLQDVSQQAWDFLSAPDTHISTSLDGDLDVHQRQRTISAEKTYEFTQNLGRALTLSGMGKVSALPTIDSANPPSPEALIDAFAKYGFRSIYLRPVNYQGFARKRFGRGDDDDWNAYYGRFIDALVAYNQTAHDPLEEFYFTHCLRRVLRAGHHGHVDLRNPNVLGADYLVVDYDGTLYPTDEARMVTRMRQVDLSIGTIFAGLNSEKLAALNVHAANNLHEDCIHCAFQPFCGVDLIDDISRYGRVDLPKHETSFCRRHMGVFRKVFQLLYSTDPAVQHSLALWLGVPALDESLAPALA